MNNKGFTLIELLAVLVIIAIVSTLGTAGIKKLSANIKENMLSEKKELILYEAKVFGEDYKSILTGTCTIGVNTKQKCKSIKVQDLIDNGYLTPKDKCVDGSNEVDCFKNNITDENMNNLSIYIYYDDNDKQVYAEMD
jgi:prepilin-type N-terminal cleavage/methylation domain-containing protein